MRPIHLAAIEPKSTVCAQLKYIQVKEGFAYATDKYILVRIPNKELFGENVVLNNEHFYIVAENWKKAKMWKAFYIVNDGNFLIALNKSSNEIGRVAKVQIRDFPNCDKVFPDKKQTVATDYIFINPEMLHICSRILSDYKSGFCYTFHGISRAIVITCDHSDSIGLVMPLKKTK